MPLHEVAKDIDPSMVEFRTMYAILRTHGLRESPASRQPEPGKETSKANHESVQPDTVELRTYARSDAAALYQALDLSRDAIERYTPLKKLKSVDALHAVIKASVHQRTYTILHNAVPVGTIAAWYESPASRDPSISHSWLGFKYRGKGIMKLAKPKFYAKEFASGAHSVTSQIKNDNTPNKMLMRSLGLAPRGYQDNFLIYTLHAKRFAELTQATEGPWSVAKGASTSSGPRAP